MDMDLTRLSKLVQNKRRPKQKQQKPTLSQQKKIGCEAGHAQHGKAATALQPKKAKESSQPQAMQPRSKDKIKHEPP